MLDSMTFGTSGWRARIVETCPFANLRRLTGAIVAPLRETGEAALSEAAARHVFS